MCWNGAYGEASVRSVQGRVRREPFVGVICRHREGAPYRAPSLVVSPGTDGDMNRALATYGQVERALR